MAHRHAVDLGQSAWEHAAQLPVLQLMGVAQASLRLLHARDLIEHRWEVRARKKHNRAFRPAPCSAFTGASCFALTAAGVDLAERIAMQRQVRLDPAHELSSWHLPHYHSQPGWRVLHFRGQIVKRFKGPVGNQELILAAFQEQQWARHLDDPLPPSPDIDAKVRLHDAIKNLNSRHVRPLIRFRGDGTGKGILWESV